ncbi:hypothetical protein H1V43_24305 [Streptomyces sp. PSKA54]|uniref:Uncharacterized protein n=1 Tax=Streptomyces himalayensis subsp. aureolus TaxID=2758039 RepID=A0A7W2HI34_9ACTN|nr:hypothetical protein [Streptomyces himalayensis]MBA4864419.1 hypothetical protein [Streptomyces himalayensis subsp. aureolus]
MDDQRASSKRSKLPIYGLVVVLLLAAIGGGVAWWIQGREKSSSQASRPVLPATLCSTSISTRPISEFHAGPKDYVRMRDGRSGGLDDRLEPYSVDQGELMCSLDIDGDAIIITASLEESHISQSDVDTEVENNGANAISWGKAKGYVSGAGTSELGVVYFPCTLRNSATDEQLDWAVRASVAAPALRQDKLDGRKAIMALTADVTAYVAKHSAKCLNVKELPSTPPALQ